MLLKTLRLKSMLSFKHSTIELGQLNVLILIGPNAVGKSNLIESHQFAEGRFSQSRG